MTARDAQPARRHRFTRTLTMTKPGIGTVLAHSRPWPPRHVVAMTYLPPDQHGVAWDIPEDRWDDILDATSALEVMAMLRNTPD